MSERHDRISKEIIPAPICVRPEEGRPEGEAMLNEEKIRLMTEIAMFEKKAQKDVFPINRYFKGDYISIHLIRSFAVYTLTCMICLALWILYRSEELLNTMEIRIFTAYAKNITVYYAAGLFFYLAVTWLVYFRRYTAASKNMKIYQAKLRRLEKKYEASASRESEGEQRR